MSTELAAVRIKRDGGEPRLSRSRLYVSVAEERPIVWEDPEGTLELRFTGGAESPFQGEGVQVADGGHRLRAGKLRPGLTPGATYPYELVLLEGTAAERILRGVIVIQPVVVSDERRIHIKVLPTGKLSIVPEFSKVNRKKQEAVEWVCDDGSFEIVFDKNGTPFSASRFSGMKSLVLASGKCRTDAEEKTHNYTVTVWPASGAGPISVDPGVVVEDDGGDER